MVATRPCRINCRTARDSSLFVGGHLLSDLAEAAIPKLVNAHDLAAALAQVESSVRRRSVYERSVYCPGADASFQAGARIGRGTRARVTAGAIVGSLATNEGDRWSDLDLTFAVTSEGEVTSVLDGLAEALAAEFDAVHLFDLPSDGVIYRVLLLRGCIQLDLSAAPQEEFGAGGPMFGRRVRSCRLTGSPELCGSSDGLCRASRGASTLLY